MKLKHRITATILLIAFATTTALPAAGIPNLKNPPATVKVAPAPRTPVAPRVVNLPKVPVAPKVINVPKAPVVKVPVAPKIPVAPRIVTAPKVPAVPKIAAAPKVPVLKVPVVVKVPASVQVVTAQRISASKSPLKTTTKTSPATTMVTRPALNPKRNGKDVRKIANEASNSPLITRMPDLAGLPALPSRDLPGSRKPSLVPSGEKKPSMDGTSGTATPTIGNRPAIPALDGGVTAKPAFDNGFGGRPQLSEADLGNVLNLNPMKGGKSGAGSGGLLSSSLSGHNGNPFGGIAQQGTGAISLSRRYATDEEATFAMVANLHLDGYKDQGHSGPAPVDIPVETEPQAPQDEPTFIGTPDPVLSEEPSASTPDPENRHKGNHTFGVAVGQQIKQGKSGRKNALGGGADVTPVNESLTDGMARIPGAVVPQVKNGMVGNPGQQGGPENGGTTPPSNSNDQGTGTNPNPIDD